MGKAPARHREIIGEAPECGPAEFDKAWEFVARIDAAIAKGGWDYGTRNQLYVLKGKWRKRAEGQDARFNVAGTRPGRLTWDDEVKVHALEARARRRKRKR